MVYSVSTHRPQIIGGVGPPHNAGTRRPYTARDLCMSYGGPDMHPLLPFSTRA